MSRVPDRPAGPHVTGPGRIVQVRGASGSGKSSLVRAVMAGLGRPNRWMVAGRREPLALTFDKPVRPLCVVGHYGPASTGGVDTIKDKEQPYAVARRAIAEGFDVLLEGIFISIEYWRTLYLHQDGYDRRDVFIDLSVEECTEWVHRRQEAAGKERKALKQMADFHPRILHTRDRLLAAGVPENTLQVASSSAFMGSSIGLEERSAAVRQDALLRIRELLSCA